MLALRPAATCLILTWPLVLSVASAEARPSPSPMVAKINAAREAQGMRALRYSRSLTRSSSRYARYLLRSDRFAHAGRIIASARFSKLGEILALTHGWKLKSARTLGYWLGSPSHRAVLLSSSFRYVGAAGIRGRLGRRRAVVWTVQFGR